jgi:hypothetical protein
MRDVSTEAPVQLLLNELSEVSANPSLPRIVVLYGETGRGKTYSVQRFYDLLAVSLPGYWRPGLAPDWPPRSLREVRHGRKQLEAIAESEPSLEVPPFLWVSAGASLPEGAVDVDMSAVVATQVSRSLSRVVAASGKRKNAAREAASLALDVLGVLVPPIGLAKSAVSHGDAARRLLAGEVDALSRSRLAIHGAFAAWAQATKRSAPAVLVLDDAQSLDADTLFLLSGLVAAAPDEGQRSYEGSALLPAHRCPERDPFG